MKKILPILFTITLGVVCAECGSSRLNHGVPKKYYTQFQGGQMPRQQSALKKDSARYNPSTLIIYYEEKTGKSELLKAVKSYGATLLYQYNNFNGIAISIPKDKILEEAIQYFGKVKGVVSVNKDYVYKLD